MWSDTLLDLHSKLQTAMRYYDRILEERFSQAYSRHSINSYNRPQQRPLSSMYPSIASAQNGPAGSEGYYAGNAQPEQYVQSQSTYPHMSHPQYTLHDVRPPSRVTTFQSGDQQPAYNQYQQAPLRSVDWQEVTSAPQEADVQYHASAPAASPSQPPSAYAPSESAMSPSVDPNASFYYGNNVSQAPPQQTSGGISQPQPVVNQQLPEQHHQIPQPQQQSQTVPQQAGLDAHPQQPYWQAHQQNPSTQQPWQTPEQTLNGYTQESFPSAPHHAPQQPAVAVEEALIEF